MIRQTLAAGLLATLVTSATWAQDQPQSLDPRIQISLFAENPQIVTPTGIDVDEAGRVWAIESNTHFPPEGYAGHPTDRVLVFADTDSDGKADDPTVFVDGIRHAMSIAVRPAWMAPISLSDSSSPLPPGEGPGVRVLPTQVFVATRRDLKLLEDTDGDGKSDREHVLLQLDTKGDYPHNGLAGWRSIHSIMSTSDSAKIWVRPTRSRDAMGSFSPVELRAVTSIDSVRMARSSSSGRLGSGTRTRRVSMPWGTCSPSTTTRTAGRRAD